MGIVQLILTLVILEHRFGLVSTEEWTFIQNTDYKNKLRSTRIIKSFTAQSRLHCFSQCTGSPRCVSIFYNQKSRNCQLHDVMFVTAADGDVSIGTNYYVIDDGYCSGKDGFIYGRLPKICYKIVKAFKNWMMASDNCTAANMTLVMLNTPEKYFYLTETLRQSTGLREDVNYHIGLNDIDNESEFVWLDGTTAEWTIWENENPSVDRNKNCVVISGNPMTNSGQLKFLLISCDITTKNRFNWICERFI